MKKSFKLVSSLCVGLLAVGAGVALSGANKVSKSVSAASSDKWSIIGSRTSWATDFGDFAYDSVNKFYGTDVAGRFALNISLDKDESFKVRKDKDWTVSIGYGGQTGQGIGSYLSQEGENFKVKANGDYLITLHTDVSTYGDKSYGFAIAKSYNITVMDGEKTAGSLYYEDYSNSGFTIEYSSSSFPKEGYTLEGLYEEPTFDTKVESGSLATSQNYTLYAKYVEAVADGYYLVGSMTEWVLDEEYLMAFNDEKNEYSIEHTFDLDDEFKIVHHTNASNTYYGYEVLESGTNSAKDAGQIVAAAVEDKPNMKVAYAGTYTPYFKANDTSIWISAIEETHTYRLDVTHSDTTVNSYNVVAHEGTEFVTETNVPVVAGDTLAFYKDDVIQTINPKIVGNNNCYSDNGVTTVLLNMNAKIYVDFANGTCFCGGMTFGEFGLVVDNNYVRMTYNNDPVDPSFTEWYKQGYTFAKGADIKFVDTTLTDSVAKVFSVLKINEVAKDKGFEVLDGHLLCTADGGKTTDIYVKFKTDADEVYFGDVKEDLQAAIDFAKAFNDSIGGVCRADASTDKTAMKEAWAAMSADFSKLIEAAQNIIKSATTEHANDDIKAFAAKYDYVFAKYGTAWELNNFAGRTPAASAPFTYALSANNNTLITIVVVCSVSSITLLGAILLIKRRRNAVK